MRSVDELLAGLLAGERRTEELIAVLLDETACEESSDDEDEDEEMRIIQEDPGEARMRSVDELMAELLDGERRTEELCVALLDGM